MKSICFILSPELPFPPTKGGAVETLLELFVSENEKYQKYKITVFSIHDDKAENQSRDYKLTTVKYIKEDFKKNWKNRLNALLFKITKKKIPYLNDYVFQIKKEFRKGYHPECIIIEGGNYRDYQPITKFVGIDKMTMHIHAITRPKFHPQKYFRNYIFVSEAAQAKWFEEFSGNGFILHNAVDESLFSLDEKYLELDFIDKKHQFSQEDFIVLYCGRLTEQKGVLELIKAINRIKHKNVKLLIVGSSNFLGAHKTEYQLELEKSLSERVSFTGYIHNKEVVNYYKRANLVVSPSLRDEAASLVNIEAMIAGKAIITTKQGGNSEYVNPDGAILLENPENKEQLVEQLATSITYLYEKPNKINEMETSNKHYARLFTKQSYFENFSSIIEQLVSNEGK